MSSPKQYFHHGDTENTEEELSKSTDESGRMRMPKVLLFFALVVSLPAAAQSLSEKVHGPDCSGLGSWPTMMTLVHMKNAGMINAREIDPSQTKTVRLASEKISKDLWHQVYHVAFTMKSGEVIDAIAVHDASDEECSMSGVDVFVISKHLPPEGR